MKRSNKRCEMRAQGGSAEIFIYEEIDPFWGIGAKLFAEDLKALGDVSSINVRLNSPGGDVFDGLAIYNLLKNHKADVNVDVDGLAASIASVIALSGDTVRMAENAMMMIHNPWTVAIGDAAELRETADVLDKVGGTLVTTYVSRTGKDEAEIAGLMSDETWFSAAEAVENGFADEVTGQQKVAAKFDLTRFRNAPKDWNNQQPEDDVPWRRYALERKLRLASHR